MESFFNICRSRLLRKTVIYMVVVYGSDAVIYDTLVRITQMFGLDFFITFTINVAIEIPSVLLLTLLLDRCESKSSYYFKLHNFKLKNYTISYATSSSYWIITFIYSNKNLQMCLFIFVHLFYTTFIFDALASLMPTAFFTRQPFGDAENQEVGVFGKNVQQNIQTK